MITCDMFVCVYVYIHINTQYVAYVNELPRNDWNAGNAGMQCSDFVMMEIAVVKKRSGE